MQTAWFQADRFLIDVSAVVLKLPFLGFWRRRADLTRVENSSSHSPSFLSIFTATSLQSSFIGLLTQSAAWQSSFISLSIHSGSSLVTRCHPFCTQCLLSSVSSRHPLSISLPSLPSSVHGHPSSVVLHVVVLHVVFLRQSLHTVVRRQYIYSLLPLIIQSFLISLRLRRTLHITAIWGPSAYLTARPNRLTTDRSVSS